MQCAARCRIQHHGVDMDSSFCWEVCVIDLGEVLGAVLGAVYLMKPGWDHFCGKGRGLCPRRQFGHSCIKVGHSWLDTLEIKYSIMLLGPRSLLQGIVTACSCLVPACAPNVDEWIFKILSFCMLSRGSMQPYATHQQTGNPQDEVRLETGNAKKQECTIETTRTQPSATAEFMTLFTLTS